MKRDQAYITAAEADAMMLQIEKTTGDIVEIGTYKGGTAAHIAECMSANQVLWTVDYYPGSWAEHYPDSQDLLDEVAPKLVYRVFGSSDLVGAHWNRPIEFLFIDGHHGYDEVLKDFTVWSPWVIPGGVIAFHDGTSAVVQALNGLLISGMGGVISCVNELKDQGEWQVLREVDTTVYFKRTES